MKTSSTNTRILLAVLGVLTLLASACGVTRGGPAATVHIPDGDSVEIASSELTDIVTSIESSQRFLDAAFSGQMPEGFQAQLLTTLIIEKVIDSVLVDEGITVPESAFVESSDAFVLEVDRLFNDQAVTSEIVAELAPYLDSLSRIRAKQGALADELAANQPEAETVLIPCTRHILVETLDEADDLAGQIQQGADFGDLASEFSQDPGSGAQGGSLGCSAPDRFVEPFRDAILAGEQGEILGPVETQFGFHLIIIDEYEETVLDEVDAAELASQRISAVLSVMPDVDVDPTIGFWDPGRLIVSPAVQQPGQ